MFKTKTSDAVTVGGFYRLKNGTQISKRPLWDSQSELWARFNLAEAREWCATAGARLPSVPELRELHDASRWVRPVTLPTIAMCKAAGFPLTEAAINSYRNANMSSRKWCAIHDQKAAELLDGLDGEPVANVGKCWTGEGGLFGWRREDGSYIQNLYTGHGLGHRDYASTTYVVQESAPDTKPSGGVSRGTLGEAVLAEALTDLDAGIREDLGRNDGHKIREYLKPWRLKPPQNWCSVAVAAWLVRACRLHGLPQPIKGSPGAQATMGQLKRAGLWVPAQRITPADLTPGAVIVWQRGRPGSWMGHIGLVDQPGEPGHVWTVEGNSGPRGDCVARMDRKLDDPRLFGIGRLDGFEGAPLPEPEPTPDEEPPIFERRDPLEADADVLFAEWFGAG